MRRRHPRVLYLYWSKNAFERTGDPHAWLDFDEDDPLAERPTRYLPRKLFPSIRIDGRARPRVFEFFESLKRGHVASDQVPDIEVTGPISDDVVPIIFGEDHGGVYVRTDVAKLLSPHMSPTQRLLPVLCDGELISYQLLIDLAQRVWLLPCVQGDGGEFDDGDTLTIPIFPDRFSNDYGVHFVGNYSGLFLDLKVWTLLRNAVPNLKYWISTKRIIVDDSLGSEPGMEWKSSN